MARRDRTDRPRTRTAVRSALAVLGPAVVLAAGCGGSGSKPVAAPTLSGGSPATTAPAVTSSPTTPSPTSTTPATPSTTPSTTPPTTHPSTTHPPSTTAPTTAPATGLTARQTAGQRVIYSYSGLTPPDSLLQAIRNGEAAGVIFFSGNIANEAQLASVTAQLRQAQQQSPVHVPLLLMTDQEGGQVRRLPGAPLQSAKQIGQSSDATGAASRAGAGAAQNLAGVGMNVNLAPVVDVYYQPGDFIDQTERSFGSDPASVANLGRAFISAQQNAGVAATAKHFPGLGSAPVGSNTDLRPVTLSVSLDGLRVKDEVPYQAAIASGVKLVMVSWAVYPALDASRPAGLSSAVVQQELRQRNGFKGVTVTDALEAGALNAYGTPGQRAVTAAGAGMDLLLCSSGDVNQGVAATTALAAAEADGQLSQAGFNAAVQRVTALRSGLK